MADGRLTGEVYELLHQTLALLIPWMGLASHDQLYRPLGMNQDTGQSIRIMEEQIGVEQLLGFSNRAGIRAMLPQLLRPMLTHGGDQGLASLGAKRPQLLVG